MTCIPRIAAYSCVKEDGVATILLYRLAWLLFSVGHKLTSEPHRIEYGAGRLAKAIWEATR